MELCAAVRRGWYFQSFLVNSVGDWLHSSSVDLCFPDVSLREMSGQRVRWFQLLGMPNSLVFLVLE
jgi:hypothetical protein